MNKRPLVIKPLSRLDDYLLTHKPEIWSARAHLVTWYCLIFIFVLSVLCFVTGTDARINTNVEIWIGFVIVIAILALVVWIIYLLRFNVFKRYGIITRVGSLVTFLLYFIAAGIIVAFCFVPPAVETIRARNIYTNAELIDDINSINTKVCQLEYNILPKIWQRDTVHIVDSISGGNDDAQDSYQRSYDVYRPNNYEIDTATNTRYQIITRASLQQMISNKDSIRKINDSVYISFTIPDFRLLKTYTVTEDSNHLLFTSEIIYQNTLRHFTLPDKIVTQKQLNALLAKYYSKENETNNDYNENRSPSYTQQISRKYQLSNIERGVNNTGEKVNRFSGSDGIGFLRIWFYFSFCIALILFIFRHSTIRTFFLSLLVLVIILIVTSLITSFTNAASAAFFIWCFFYFILFSILGALSFYSKERNVIAGIAINLWMLLLPFIPLLITGYYYEHKQEQDMIKHLITLDYNKMHLQFLIAEIAGPVIFFILLISYIHNLYKTWYALPEQ